MHLPTIKVHLQLHFATDTIYSTTTWHSIATAAKLTGLSVCLRRTQILTRIKFLALCIFRENIIVLGK